MKFDFIIIGSGLAGLTSALILKDKGTVLLLTKSQLSDCATDLAQGGIAAVVEGDDSFDSHIKDTLGAGVFHNNKSAVEYMVKHAPQAIEWLVKQGVRFDKKNAHFSPTREAAHSYSRVLHAADFTGQEIERALIERVKKEQNIIVWENCFALKLLVEKGICFGVQVLAGPAAKVSRPSLQTRFCIPRSNRVELGSGYPLSRHPQSLDTGKDIINCFARATILASGGLGQVYQWTTNPIVATGDGIALGYRAGANISDLEFIQFHPTALKDGKSPLFLLSEALRGEGGYLVNGNGERFMEKVDERKELAPRDIVARAIFNEQKEGFVYLDIRHKGKIFLQKRFPNIFLELLKRGFDLTTDLIPVTPAAHYSCGGIKTDLYGRTNIKNLFAFGEVACTGVHGANRLASNSLLEAVVFPLRLGGEILCSHSGKRVIERVQNQILEFPDIHRGPQNDRLYSIRRKLQHLMWEKVGIIRTNNGLKEALEKINQWEKELNSIDGINVDLVETKNMILVAKLITQSASRRPKSLGAHFMV
jgi:L-aspartate oxidase